MEETVELKLTKEQQDDVELFKKDLEGVEFNYHHVNFFRYMDGTTIFMLSNRPFRGDRKIKPCDVGGSSKMMWGYAPSALDMIRRFLPKAKHIFVLNGLLNIRLKSELYLIVAPKCYEMDEKGYPKVV